MTKRKDRLAFVQMTNAGLFLGQRKKKFELILYKQGLFLLQQQQQKRSLN